MSVVGTAALVLLVAGAHIGVCVGLTVLLARPRRRDRAGRDRGVP